MILNFSERIKELQTKRCAAHQNRPGLSPKVYAFSFWIQTHLLHNSYFYSDLLCETKMLSKKLALVFLGTFIKFPTECRVARPNRLSLSRKAYAIPV